MPAPKFVQLLRGWSTIVFWHRSSTVVSPQLAAIETKFPQFTRHIFSYFEFLPSRIRRKNLPEFDTLVRVDKLSWDSDDEEFEKRDTNRRVGPADCLHSRVEQRPQAGVVDQSYQDLVRTGLDYQNDAVQKRNCLKKNLNFNFRHR